MALTNKEVPHLWFYQEKERATAGGGNLYFEGPAIYSYGKHYTLGYMLELPEMLSSMYTKFVVLNDYNYSVSTSQHQSLVRQAVDRYTAIVVHVPDIPFYGGKADLNDLVSLVIPHLDNMMVSCFKHIQNTAKKTVRDINSLDELRELPPPHDGIIDSTITTITQVANVAEKCCTQLSKKEKKILQRLMHWVQALPAVCADELQRAYKYDSVVHRPQREAKQAAERRRHRESGYRMAYRYKAFPDMLKGDMLHNPENRANALRFMGPMEPEIPSYEAFWETLGMSKKDVALRLASGLIGLGNKARHTPAELLVDPEAYLLAGLACMDMPSAYTSLGYSKEVMEYRENISKVCRIVRNTLRRKIVTYRAEHRGEAPKECPDLSALLYGLYGIKMYDLVLGYQVIWVEGKYVHTSGGVRIPARVFKQYCQILPSLRSVNDVPDHLRTVHDAYKIHEINEEFITVGCHKMLRYNINMVAQELCSEGESHD